MFKEHQRYFQKINCILSNVLWSEGQKKKCVALLLIFQRIWIRKHCLIFTCQPPAGCSLTWGWLQSHKLKGTVMQQRVAKINHAKPQKTGVRVPRNHVTVRNNVRFFHWKNYLHYFSVHLYWAYRLLCFNF